MPAFTHPVKPLAPTPGQQREALEAAQRRALWFALAAPIVLLLAWPIVLVVLARCWLSHARPAWRPAPWLPALEGATVFAVLWDVGQPWVGLHTYVTALTAWTFATLGHAHAGLPLWDAAYARDLWWLTQTIWLPVTIVAVLLTSWPGAERLIYLSAFRPRGGRGQIEAPTLTFTTAGELVKRPPTILRGLWGSHFPKRSLTMLHAREKLGKSTLLAWLFRAFGDGAPVFGLETMPCTILYATEETGDVFREKATLLPPNVQVVCADQVQGMITWDNWPAVLSDLVSQATRIGARLVVVDTAGHYLPGAELGTVRAQQAVYLLKEAVAHGVAILLVHHDGKNGRARGPVALMAGMDRVIHLEEVEGDKSMRRLSFSGRFASKPPDDLVYRMEDNGALTLLEGGEDGLVVPGEAETPAPAEKPDDACRAILAFLAGTPHGGAERPAVGVAVELKRNATYDHLDHLVQAGRVVIRGRGTRGDPRVYWLTEKAPPAPGEVPVEELIDAG